MRIPTHQSARQAAAVITAMVITGTASAEVIGTAVEKMDFSAGYVLHDGSVVDPGGEVSDAWPAFDAMYDVFRVYVVVDQPDDAIAIVASSADNNFPLMLESGSNFFWNHPSGSDTAPNPNLALVDAGYLFDTWVTINRADHSAPTTALLNGPADLSADFYAPDFGWYCDPMAALDPEPVGDGTYRALIAQLTVLEGDGIGGQMRVSGPGLGTDNFLSFSTFQPEDLTAMDFDGEAPSDQFGRAVACAGDVDADGVVDFIVGAPFSDDGDPDGGRVLVYSGFDGSLIHDANGQRSGDRFGWAVGCAGDVDGDGHDDFVVGAPYHQDKRGAVYVYSGATGSRLFKEKGEEAGDRFGHSVSGNIDFDRDGLCDIIVGAPYNDDSDTQAGKAYVVNGEGQVIYEFIGENKKDRFGWSVAGLQRTSSSIRGDIAVGAPWNDDDDTNAGKVYVFKNRSGGLRFSKTGKSRKEYFGRALGSAGHIDNDSLADIVVGAPYYNHSDGRDKLGRVEVISGRDGERFWQKKGSAAGDLFGWAVAGAGDLDGDGYDDVAIGVPKYDPQDVGSAAGRVLIRSGADGSSLLAPTGSEAGERYGYAVAIIPGSNIWDTAGYAISGAYASDSNGSNAGRIEAISLDPPDVGDAPMAWDEADAAPARRIATDTLAPTVQSLAAYESLSVDDVVACVDACK